MAIIGIDEMIASGDNWIHKSVITNFECQKTDEY